MIFRQLICWFAVLAITPITFAATNTITTASDNLFPVTITVDAAKPVGELKPIWRMFGADEPNYATMPNGKKLIGELGALKPGDIYFRAHNLLCTGDGTPALKWGSTGVYSEDADGKPVYNWKILDEIFDTYLTNGVKPYAQIGFMPEALSIHPQPYQHHWQPGAKYSDIETGWAYPPKDYAKWGELIYQWVNHCITRYGRAEVETWYWEVWNEANGSYWKAKPEEFQKLHDYAVDAVRRALPTARVGGPDSAGSGGNWTRAFLKHCLTGTNYATGQIGTPIDFVSFHAKGSPVFTNGHVRMGIASQLRAADDGFSIVASYPELKSKPIVIGESDPEGCAACQGDQMGYRNGTMYSSYTAASFPRILELARRHGVNLDAALTWAFTFENQPLFAGFRQLASGGIDLPVLNVFRMFSRMSGQQLAVTSDGAVSLDDMKKNGVRAQPDVSALASLDKNQLAVLVWYYHDDDLSGPDAAIDLNLTGVPFKNGPATLTQYRIDADHSNSYEAWLRMGSPPAPSPAQYAELVKAGQLATMGHPETVRVQDGKAEVKFKLPRQGVALLILQWSK
jgi:xylan 1,4-beta-xylosidase